RGAVVRRLSRGEARIQMEVAVDERRRSEPAPGVERFLRVHVEASADARKAVAFNREVEDTVAAGEPRVPHEEVGRHGGIVIGCGCESRAGSSSPWTARGRYSTPVSSRWRTTGSCTSGPSRGGRR